MSRRGWFLTGFLVVAAPLILAGPAGAAKPSPQSLGPNVLVFDPSMPTSQIQAAVDAVAAQQVPNQFGPQRYALLFKPGTYGTAAQPLNFQLGYYTAVAGLGASPGDVVINGSVYVRNQCFNGSCTALNNFWRSLSNLTINVNNPTFGCYFGEFWAVSQAAPMRRVHVNGQSTLMDYCTGAVIRERRLHRRLGIRRDRDQRFAAAVADPQQPPHCVDERRLEPGVLRHAGRTGAVFPRGGLVRWYPYTTVATSPVTREAPYLYVNAAGDYNVFVPATQRNTSGTTWSTARHRGRRSRSTSSSSQSRRTTCSDQQCPREGPEPALHPGRLRRRPDDQGETCRHRRARARVRDARAAGRRRADDRRRRSGRRHLRADLRRRPRQLARAAPGRHSARHKSDPDDLTALQDVFFRIGGAAAGKATVSLEVNSDDVILDDIWAWRADHGNGVGWTVNTADTGVVVNGDDVTAYGLFVEHFQKYEVIWNGNGGRSSSSRTRCRTTRRARQRGWRLRASTAGRRSRSPIPCRASAATAWAATASSTRASTSSRRTRSRYPTRCRPSSLHDLLTIFLDPSVGKGGILNVVNNTGGPRPLPTRMSRSRS